MKGKITRKIYEVRRGVLVYDATIGEVQPRELIEHYQTAVDLDKNTVFEPYQISDSETAIKETSFDVMKKYLRIDFNKALEVGEIVDEP